MVLLLVCALSRVTLPESLAVNQELILLAATVVPLLLCLVELIVFAAPVLLLLMVVLSGARRRRDCDAASPGGPGANLCLRRDPDALAVGAAPLRCAPPAAARLRGQREAEAAGGCLDVIDSEFLFALSAMHVTN